MHNLHPIPSREIRLADNSIIQAHAAGDLILEAHHKSNSVQKVTVKDVLLVPKLGLNLLSCSRLAEKGVTSVFDKHGCSLIDTQNNNDILARAQLRDNLYWISNMVATPVAENATTVSNKTMSDDVTMWHNRLAHVNRKKISDMIRDKQLPPDAKLDVEKCSDCSSGKQTRDSFQGRIDKAVKKGDIIHSDVVGPLPQSVSGARYFVTFIDEFTRFVTATPIKTKSMVLESFKEFKVMFEKQFECTIKCFHSDNGGEYTPVEKYAKQAGIAVTRSAPYTPQSNGVAERMNRTLIESVRTTLLQSGLPKSFWAEALAMKH
jgi:Integrase core domain/GAG-pre-integrase domain